MHITCALFSKDYSIVDARKMLFTSVQIGEVGDKNQGMDIEVEVDKTQRRSRRNRKKS